MKWLLVVLLATLAATVVVNVLLLGYGGGSKNDPVGQLSPVADLQQPANIPLHLDDRHTDGADD